VRARGRRLGAAEPFPSEQDEAALASVSGPAARQLADDVRIEVVALTEGLASAAGAEGPPRSAETI
jgi:hypothetical protein